MPRQLAFDLPAKPALGREDFFVSPANAVAVATLEDWQAWPQRKLALIGPKGSGKTHLVHVWAAEAGGRVLSAAALAGENIEAIVGAGSALAIEDADVIAGTPEAELALFHLHNHLLAEDGFLLLTGTTPPRHWALQLPDLASRMQGTSIVRLDPPDDALLKAVLLKLFADRQLAVPPTVIEYLVKRMERSFAGAQRLVAALDQTALAERRSITRALATAVLDNGTEGAA